MIVFMIFLSVMMASNEVCKKRKMSQDSVKQSATLQPIPWEDIAPDNVCEWLDIFSKANNTTKEIALASILPNYCMPIGEYKGESRLQATRGKCESFYYLPECPRIREVPRIP